MPKPPMMPSPLTLLLAVCLCLLLLVLHRGGGPAREGFASERANALHRRTVDVFTTKDLSYTTYKHHVKEADPVLHRDLKRQYLDKTLTPEGVQRALLPY